MSEWTHFSASITIENNRELKIRPFIELIEKYQERVVSGKCTWDDIEENVISNNGINTSVVWNQFIQECFVPEVTLAEMKVKIHNKMPDVILDNGSIYSRFTPHPVPCPFRSSFPLEHYMANVRFYKNTSPDGRLLTFTYAGDVEEWIDYNHIDKWVKSIEGYFRVHSGSITAARNIPNGTKHWCLGKCNLYD